MHAELLGLTMTYSKSELIEDLVLGAVLAILGYRFSERFRRTRGVTPWRLPSAAWAVLLFFVPPVAVLYLLACITTRSRTGPQGWNGPAAGWGQGQGGPPPPPQDFKAPQGSWTQPPPQGWDAPGPGGSPPPGYNQGPPGGWVAAPPPGGWEAPPPPGTPFPGFSPTGSPDPAAVPAPQPSPRNWLADPSGRHELRYWDGTKFTEHVADAGKITVDPL